MQKPMEGRTAVVFGVANKRSIAWGIAQAMQAAGARLAITYQNERLEAEAKDLITALPGAQAFHAPPIAAASTEIRGSVTGGDDVAMR